MNNTYSDGDFVFVWKLDKNPQRGDIIISRSLKSDKNLVIKRVIAIPGDKIKIENKKVILNGKQLNEDYIKWETGILADDNMSNEMVVPFNHYVILGDNRDNSYDTRSGGFLYKNDIIGKVITNK